MPLEFIKSLFWNCFFFTLYLPVLSQAAEINISAKRVLFIDSYHQDYSWSARIAAGAREILNAEGMEMEIYSMDTKRNPD